MAENKKPEKIPMVTVYHLEDWRNWLAKNHLTEKKVGLINYKKHTGKPSINHRTAMKEAICFGWIDTTLKRLDEKRFVRHFVKRGDNASWGKNTLKYGKELLAAGKMAPHGILRYQQGLKKKPHDYGIPKNPAMPSELKKALSLDKEALKKFETFSPSTKRMFYRNILRAKTDKTRNKRIESVIKNALDKKQ